ncbi:MAG: phosphoribosylanthranilate isomerase [Puniceicoccaceae bacterium]
MEPPVVKICGLTRREDAALAFESGARFGGVNGVPGSPRFVEPGSAAEAEVLSAIPPGRRIWVAVEPAAGEVEAALGRGFDRVQVHFDPAGGFDPAAPSAAAGPGAIWLAPRMRQPDEFRPGWLEMAEAFLIDGFSADRFGGTGKRVDAAAFARLAAAHAPAVFILAGGLAPGDIAAVLRGSGARWIDVNSGVESGPGVKDPEKIKSLFANLAARGD